MKLQPLIYQDDLKRFLSSIGEAQDNNAKMETYMKVKLFYLDKDKSCFMMSGNPEKRYDFQKQISQSNYKWMKWRS